MIYVDGRVVCTGALWSPLAPHLSDPFLHLTERKLCHRTSNVRVGGSVIDIDGPVRKALYLWTLKAMPEKLSASVFGMFSRIETNTYFWSILSRTSDMMLITRRVQKVLSIYPSLCLELIPSLTDCLDGKHNGDRSIFGSGERNFRHSSSDRKTSGRCTLSRSEYLPSNLRAPARTKVLCAGSDSPRYPWEGISSAIYPSFVAAA